MANDWGGWGITGKPELDSRIVVDDRHQSVGAGTQDGASLGVDVGDVQLRRLAFRTGMAVLVFALREAANGVAMESGLGRCSIREGVALGVAILPDLGDLAEGADPIAVNFDCH